VTPRPSSEASDEEGTMAEDREKLAGNTNESADEDVEAHARYTGNTNESIDEDDDDEVEAHMRPTP
jgi:hypothetical protein